jgi:hypothetical protein
VQNALADGSLGYDDCLWHDLGNRLDTDDVDAFIRQLEVARCYKDEEGGDRYPGRHYFCSVDDGSREWFLKFRITPFGRYRVTSCKRDRGMR